jgi:hypothetical protein
VTVLAQGIGLRLPQDEFAEAPGLTLKAFRDR